MQEQTDDSKTEDSSVQVTARNRVGRTTGGNGGEINSEDRGKGREVFNIKKLEQHLPGLKQIYPIKQKGLSKRGALLYLETMLVYYPEFENIVFSEETTLNEVIAHVVDCVDEDYGYNEHLHTIQQYKSIKEDLSNKIFIFPISCIWNLENLVDRKFFGELVHCLKRYVNMVNDENWICDEYMSLANSGEGCREMVSKKSSNDYAKTIEGVRRYKNYKPTKEELEILNSLNDVVNSLWCGEHLMSTVAEEYVYQEVLQDRYGQNEGPYDDAELLSNSYRQKFFFTDCPDQNNIDYSGREGSKLTLFYFEYFDNQLNECMISAHMEVRTDFPLSGVKEAVDEESEEMYFQYFKEFYKIIDKLEKLCQTLTSQQEKLLQ